MSILECNIGDKLQKHLKIYGKISNTITVIIGGQMNINFTQNSFPKAIKLSVKYP